MAAVVGCVGVGVVCGGCRKQALPTYIELPLVVP